MPGEANSSPLTRRYQFDIFSISTSYQVAGWAVTTRGKESLRSAVLGHNIDFHQESNCMNNVQPDDVICAKNRCQIQVSIFSHSIPTWWQVQPVCEWTHILSNRSQRTVSGEWQRKSSLQNLSLNDSWRVFPLLGVAGAMWVLPLPSRRSRPGW